MMKYLLIFVCSILQANWGLLVAQNKQIDSLKQIIISTKEDSTRVKSLNLLSRQFYLAGNYAEALKHAEQALMLVDKMPNKKRALIFAARAHNHIGNIYYSEGNLPGALQHYLDALVTMEGIKDKKAMAASYHNIGNVYLSQ